MKHYPIFLLSLCGSILCTMSSCKEKPANAPVASPSVKSSPLWKNATELRYEVIKKLPHDPDAFLQGLEIHQGQWLESTGIAGKSTIRRVNPATGQATIRKNLSGNYFGEGLTELNGLVYQLTWKHQTGFIYDASSLEWKKNFTYQGEGWGLCNDGKLLYLSDGSDRIRVIDPITMHAVRSIQVTWEGKPVDQLNELEWIEGEIFANVWQKDEIVRIDPQTGKILSVIHLSGIDSENRRRSVDHVLNGIAYDESTGLIYVTGKCWAHIYEIRLLPK